MVTKLAFQSNFEPNFAFGAKLNSLLPKFFVPNIDGHFKFPSYIDVIYRCWWRFILVTTWDDDKWFQMLVTDCVNSTITLPPTSWNSHLYEVVNKTLSATLLYLNNFLILAKQYCLSYYSVTSMLVTDGADEMCRWHFNMLVTV